jgi:hypothetical protein
MVATAAAIAIEAVSPLDKYSWRQWKILTLLICLHLVRAMGKSLQAPFYPPEVKIVLNYFFFGFRPLPFARAPGAA